MLDHLRRRLPASASFTLTRPAPQAYTIREIVIEQLVPVRPPTPVGWADSRARRKGRPQPSELAWLRWMVVHKPSRQFFVRIGELAANAGYAEERNVGAHDPNLPHGQVVVAFWSEDEVATIYGNGVTYEAAYIDAMTQIYGWDEEDAKWPR